MLEIDLYGNNVVLKAVDTYIIRANYSLHCNTDLIIHL